jgi:3-methyladenine DNA glycosylase AlkD
MEVVGTPTAVLRGIARSLGTAQRAAPAERVIGTAQALVDSGAFEARQVAYLLIEARADAVRALGPRRIELLGRGMDNWASVDTFSCCVAGLAWNAGRLADATVVMWARARDRWWRRAALASTVPLNLASRGGAGDPRRTLRICTILASDGDDMVAKALSWALRSLVPHDRAAVRRFLARHEGVLAARVLREVRNKLDTGLKNPRGKR